MNEPLQILLVEDSDFDATVLVSFLSNAGVDFNHTRVWDRSTFEDALEKSSPDLIIADHELPEFNGMDAFRIAKANKKNIPFILVTGTVSENILTEYAKEGVDDYPLKNNLLRLPSAIEHLLNKRKIEDLNKQLEIAQREIRASINCAKRIQNSMLSNTQIFKRVFAKSFGLFRPKDILSGDFYWLKQEEESFFIAVADCTGHGIPGALMSMIGIEKLNTLVLQTKEPDEILTLLHQSIEETLGQSALHEHSCEGMDIVLCSVDKKNRSLKFSGANRPLWIIRNSTGELEEIRGTKRGIGGFTSGLNPEFVCHEISLQPDDTFYLTSDGYADQFGGPLRRKITTEKFKQTLVDIQDQPMAQQEAHLANYFDDWKNGADQVDDMLVVGVRV